MPARLIVALRSQVALLGVIAVFGMLVVTTCGRSTTAPATSSTSPGPAVVNSQPSPSVSQPINSSGRVQGWVMRGPGLDPRSGGGGRQVPVSGDPVTARDGSGSTAATAVSARDGSFTFVLPPGMYAISEDICGTTKQIEVRSQTTASMTLTIPNAC